MSSKKLFLIISLIIGTLLGFNLVLACSRIYREVYWDDQCTDGPWTWWDFDYGGALRYTACAVGPSSQYGHGSEYWERTILGGCGHKRDIVWRYMTLNQWPPDASEGDICKSRGGVNCRLIFGGTSDYRFDTDDVGCVHCIGKRQGEIEKCGSRDVATYTCEEACGADYRCDEKNPAADLCDGNCMYLFEQDINGDRTVNILDITTVAIAFGSKCEDDDCVPGHSCHEEDFEQYCTNYHPNWNYYADIDHNDVVNILDIAAVAIAFGRTR